MLPEILKKEEYNFKCDLWSIGILLYRLYFYKSIFPGQTEESLIKDIERFNQNEIFKNPLANKIKK